MAKPTMIDFRSDTLTKPSPAMLEAMMNADVGDDVWSDDPTVNRLQEVTAAMFGHEAGLFCPSGTMTNQIAIKVHTQPGDELLCADTAHIYCYEGGGIAFNSGVQAKTLPGDHGRVSAAQIAAAITQSPDVHFPTTRLVCLENTTNKGGGAYYTLESMQEISELCRSKGIKLHLDGARIFNAIIAGGYTAAQVGPLFDSVSVCLSKGLGCPVGSLLLGSKEFIARARRVRKVLGGGMRQAGYLAAAGIYALENNVDRLQEDHVAAKRIAQALTGLPFVAEVLPVHTNIVIFKLPPGVENATVIEAFKEQGMLITQMAPGLIRIMPHLNHSQEQIDRAIELMKQVKI